MNRKIAIVLPVYNAEKKIEKMLQAIVKQTFQEWELIIVNDGSTDNTLAVLKKYAEKEERIRIHNQNNAGPAAARNAGIALTKAPYITFVDADDRIISTYLEDLYTVVEKNQEIDLVCAGYWEENKIYPHGIALHDFNKYQGQNSIDKKTFQANIFNGLTGVLWTKLFKSSIITENNIKLPENLKMSEDLIFVLRYSKYINTIGLVHKPLYYYNRIDEGSLTGKFDENLIPNLQNFNALVLEEMDDNPSITTILQGKTARQLLKMLKDQSEDKNTLKNHYDAALQAFGKSVFSVSLNLKDTIFLFLIKNKSFRLAVLWQKMLKTLHKIKHR